MFESDDFDQVLSQLDLPEVCPKLPLTNCENTKGEKNILLHHPNENLEKEFTSKTHKKDFNATNNELDSRNVSNSDLLSPKDCKRKLIKSHFDSHHKRKFPGPAGLLTGSFKEYEDENDCHIELLSQDIDFSQNPLHKHLFESIVWKRLLNDVNEWNLKSMQTIKEAKQFALIGNQRCKKAQTIYAFVESVDRAVMDPLVTLRDLTGNIKCTLHRDAWSYFSSYIVPEHCALILSRPTVLTTGSAFKKHYLNITLSNLFAIYSSIVIDDEEKPFPVGYRKDTYEDCTVIKMDKPVTDTCFPSEIQHQDDCREFLKDLDGIFPEETF